MLECSNTVTQVNHRQIRHHEPELSSRLPTPRKTFLPGKFPYCDGTESERKTILMIFCEYLLLFSASCGPKALIRVVLPGRTTLLTFHDSPGYLHSLQTHIHQSADLSSGLSTSFFLESGNGGLYSDLMTPYVL